MHHQVVQPQVESAGSPVQPELKVSRDQKGLGHQIKPGPKKGLLKKTLIEWFVSCKAENWPTPNVGGCCQARIWKAVNFEGFAKLGLKNTLTFLGFAMQKLNTSIEMESCIIPNGEKGESWSTEMGSWANHTYGIGLVFLLVWVLQDGLGTSKSHNYWPIPKSRVDHSTPHFCWLHPHTIIIKSHLNRPKSGSLGER